MYIVVKEEIMFEPHAWTIRKDVIIIVSSFEIFNI